MLTENPSDRNLNSRDRLLAALENLDPLTKGKAEMIRKSITEPREQSIIEQQAELRYECILAFCTEFKSLFDKEADNDASDIGWVYGDVVAEVIEKLAPELSYTK